MKTNKAHLAATHARSSNLTTNRRAGIIFGAVVLLSSSIAFGGDVSKAYCARFEAAFKQCSLKCSNYIKRQPEYPNQMTKQDLIEALDGCIAICLESVEFNTQDAVRCDKYR